MKKKLIYFSIFTCVALISIFEINNIVAKNTDIVDESRLESNEIAIKTEEIIEKTVVDSEISDDEILLEEIEYMPSFAIDISSIQAMYDGSDAVYIVDNLVKGECKYSRKGNPLPTTFYSAKIVKSLKENKDDIENKLDSISIGAQGGLITVRDYIDNLDENQKQILAIANTPEDDMNKYVKVTTDYYLELSNNYKYVVFLGYDEEMDFYNILAGGYGVYEYNDKDSTISNTILEKTEHLTNINLK